jgi:hypothetical protein
MNWIEYRKSQEAAVLADLKDVTLTIGQVALKHGITHRTVAKLAKEHNLCRKAGRPWGSKNKPKSGA